jgi:hypothetical protein
LVAGFRHEQTLTSIHGSIDGVCVC